MNSWQNCAECFNTFYEDEAQLYSCANCNVDICRACNSRVASKDAHTSFWNIFGCPGIIHNKMIRVFTPIWIMVYLAMTPLIAVKYSIDVTYLILKERAFQHLEPGFSSFKAQ